LTPICTKSFVGWGFAPDTTEGAYSAPPDPPDVFRGLLLKGGEGKRKSREKEGGRGREGKGGEVGSSPFRLGRKRKSQRLCR